MLLARRNTVPAFVIDAATRLLRSHPEISNVELLQRMALELGSQVTGQIPITRVERLVREPALNRIRLEDRGIPLPESPGARDVSEPRTSVGEAPSATTSRRESRGTLSVTEDAASGTETTAAAAPHQGRSASPQKSPSLPVNRLDAGLVRAVDDALLEAFTLGADSTSDAEVVEHFQDLDRVRERVRRALESM